MAKTKVQISIDSDLLEAVDEYCDKNYMNRSWVFSQAVLQVVNQQKVVDAMINVSIAVRKAVESGCSIDDETRKDIESFETLSKMFLKGSRIE